MKSVYLNSLALITSFMTFACSSHSQLPETESRVSGASDDLLLPDSKLLQLRSYVDNAGFPVAIPNRKPSVVNVRP